jgi:DNA-binding response OmpR family regulator
MSVRGRAEVAELRRSPRSQGRTDAGRRRYQIVRVAEDDPDMRVLVAEDDAAIRDLLVRGLGENGYVVDAAPNGGDALHLLRLYDYGAAVIDWRMPEVSGVDVIRSARRFGLELPVLVLTARDGLRDRVEGLDAGADDYLVKPFEFDELLARLRALLRRPARGSLTRLELGGLALDTGSRRASLRGSDLDLTRTEFAILELLLSRAPTVVTLHDIAFQVWPDETRLVGSNTIHVHIGRVRRKVEGAVRIVAVRGEGFRLEVAG